MIDLVEFTLGIRKSWAVLSGVEECLRQFGSPKHIRDVL
jgi:hypothetical protein